MAEFSGYDPGVPCWVDLATTDPEGARGFYGALLGWEFDEDPDPETGNYVTCRLRGKRVAGMGGQPPPEGVPTAWTTYLLTADADATGAKIAEAGGQLMVPPMDIGEHGRMLVAFDPTGAAFGVWQAGTHTGAELANEPGAFTWNELQTKDLAAAQDFYTKVFGYDYEAVDTGGPAYAMFKVDGRAVGGLMQQPPELPSDIPSYWATYFVVEDCDAAVATVTERGGSVLMGPEDSEFGRFAFVSDPQGAVFAVIVPPDGSGG